MSSTGRIETVKNRLMAIVASAEPSLSPQKNHVSGDWAEEIWNVKLPFVKVRIAPIVETPLVYGRKTPEDAEHEVHSFSLHIFTSATSSPDNTDSKYKNVHELADKIKTKLIQRKKSESAYGILDIYDITVRESEPAQRRRAFKLTRMIIEGKMLVKRVD